LQITKVESFVFRAPVTMPVQTSFGIMRDRPMVLVRLEDETRTSGWGEVWCNFPSVGAEHRARIVDELLAPLVTGREFEDPASLFAHLTDRMAVLTIQSGEPGPFAHAIAGIDIAAWDLWAKRQDAPLWSLLGGRSGRIPVYASGLNPTGPEKLAEARYREGYRAFKLKVGFGRDTDSANLERIRAIAGDISVMADANQAWAPETASYEAAALAMHDLQWLEEPLRADRPLSEWTDLAQTCGIPLAAGENVAGREDFSALITSGAVSVIQPDLAKWGGFSACLPVAREILDAGRRYCPHYLGGGIGLIASGHLLAAAGGDGMLEVDANDNPLRTLLCGPLNEVRDGVASLGGAPGHGITPDLDVLAPYSRPH
jgi:L-alanine-DL-glutamate epimerase-like enolase superfamily enzyme